ncbi:MAG: tryptophan--tRNA ligase [Candidatus Alcyoniella australis]|nr:tryptophan--tRNA ligase [Candidatus Alcyoniella australis]
MSKQRILSGMRPSGKLHLGHLHGALANWISLQDDYECFYFSADWHALTSEYADTSAIENNTVEMITDWIAAGIDPERCTLFIQSRVREHAELFLLFSMITPLGWAERCPTYKEQQEQVSGRDLSTYGFLGYPILQAADILIYRAHKVPVGEDQRPHVEMTREIARRFNNFYGDVFPEPGELLTQFPRVPGTDGRKMSKSYDNSLYLSDTPEQIDRKIRTMITDPARQRRKDPGDPDICPVYDLHRIYSEHETLMWAAEGCRSAGIGCLQCKAPLIEKVNQGLDPIRTRRAELLADPSIVRGILERGNQRANQVAGDTMRVVRQAIKIG